MLSPPSSTLFPYTTLFRSTALLTFSDDVRVLRDFTADPDRLASSLRGLRVRGTGAATLDAVQEALRQFTKRPRSEEHTSELQSHSDVVCRLLLARHHRTCR